jgi:hypothetical protein
MYHLFSAKMYHLFSAKMYPPSRGDACFKNRNPSADVLIRDAPVYEQLSSQMVKE